MCNPASPLGVVRVEHCMVQTVKAELRREVNPYTSRIGQCQLVRPDACTLPDNLQLDVVGCFVR